MIYRDNQNTDFSDQLDYSKYFPHFDNPILAGLAIAITICIGVIAAGLIYKNKLTKQKKIIILISSIIFGGILFGGFPNVIFLAGLTFLILIISLFFSRVFCGYVCPLGALQELTSMKKFKTSLIYERSIKKRRNILIRWSFFAAFVIIVLLFGFEATNYFNPLNGFLIIWFPLNIVFIIAFIILLGIVIISIFVYRPFYQYICPFGALASLIGRFSIIKIRRTKACFNCGICEKICPTLEGFKESKKGECYLCYRCMDFCLNEMFIDTNKVAEINRFLSALRLSEDHSQKEVYLDKILKNIIRLFIPYKRMKSFENFVEAVEGKEAKLTVFPEIIQDLIEHMNDIFPNELKRINWNEYKEWIIKNQAEWKKRINSYHKDKLFYGLSKSD